MGQECLPADLFSLTQFIILIVISPLLCLCVYASETLFRQPVCHVLITTAQRDAQRVLNTEINGSFT